MERPLGPSGPSACSLQCAQCSPSPYLLLVHNFVITYVTICILFQDPYCYVIVFSVDRLVQYRIPFRLFVVVSVRNIDLFCYCQEWV